MFLINVLILLMLSPEILMIEDVQYCYENVITVDNVKDFGKVSGVSVLKHTFTLNNISDEDIILRVIKSGCSCTKVKNDSMIIPKHGSLDIPVEYSVDTNSGIFDKSIMIIVSGKSKPLFLKIRGEIQPKRRMKRT